MFHKPAHKHVGPNGPGQITVDYCDCEGARLADVVDATPDFDVENHGSIFLIRAKTPEAREWVGEHVPHATWWGGAITVEARFVENVIDGIVNDGLTIN